MARNFKVRTESGAVLVNLDQVCTAEWRDDHLILYFAARSQSDTPPELLRIEGAAAAAIWAALESGAPEAEGTTRWGRH